MKALGIKVNTLRTPCYNIKLVYVLIKQLQLNTVLKGEKQIVFVLLTALYVHPVQKNTSLL
jgi:hypothetical protein